MKGPYLLGVDIGTQGAKALLVDLSGRVLASAYREQEIASPQPGWAEHDAEQAWWQAFVSLTREVLALAQVPGEAVAGIGCSSFVPAVLPLDAAGRPLRPAILYPDRRSHAELEWLRTTLEQAGLSADLVGEVALASPIPQWLWVRAHAPDVFDRTAKIAQPVPYLVNRLTGQHVIDHAMKRSYAPVYDAARDAWSTERAALLGLDTSVLPDRMAWASEAAGTVSAVAAAETGLRAGTPVAVGTADAFAELVGAGVVAPDTGAVLYGTFTAVMLGLAKPPSAWHGHHCLPGVYFGGAAVPTGAALTRWFRDEFGAAERAQERGGGENAYAALEREAAHVPPGCEGLVALPDFTGEPGRLHPTLGRGALVGLTLRHRRGHVYRALLEGVAYELRRQLADEALPDELTALGGGSRSRLWTQIVSDVLGRPQVVLDVPHSAPYGAAYLAGLAAGFFIDLSPLGHWLRVARRIEPAPATQAVYDRAFAAYCQAQAALG